MRWVLAVVLPGCVIVGPGSPEETDTSPTVETTMMGPGTAGPTTGGTTSATTQPRRGCPTVYPSPKSIFMGVLR